MIKTKTQQSGFWVNVREIAILLFIVWLIRTFGFGLYQVPTGSMETTMLVGERFFADKLTLLFSNIKRGEVIAFNDPTFTYSQNPVVRLFQDYIWGPTNWTKRVIGVPGDTVRGTIEDGKPVIYLNGQKLNETYVNKYPLVRVWRADPQEIARRLRGNRDIAYDMIGVKSYDPHMSFESQPFYGIKRDRVIMEGDEPSVIYPGTPIYPREKNKVYDQGQNYVTQSDEFFVKLGNNEYWVMGDNRLGSKDSRWFGPISGRLIHGRIKYRIWSIDSDEAWWPLDLLKHPIDFWKRVRWNRFFQKVL